MKKSELKDEIKRYHEECEKLKSEKESVQQELSRYIANYIELSNAAGKVKFENRYFKTENQNNITAYLRVSDELSKTKADNESLNQRILNQSESISLLRKENEKLTYQVRGSGDLIGKLNEEIERLRNILSSEKPEDIKHEPTVFRTDEQGYVYKVSYIDLVAEVEKLKKKISELTSEVSLLHQ